MPVDLAKIIKAVEEAKKCKPRNFKQSIDLIVNLQYVDVKRPEGRISELVELPNPINKEVKVCAIGTGHFALEAKRAGADRVLQKEDLEAMAGNKKAARKLAQEYDFFVAEGQLMPLVGRVLGPALGPLGVNVKAIVDKINELTKDFAGMKVPSIKDSDRSRPPRC